MPETVKKLFLYFDYYDIEEVDEDHIGISIEEIDLIVDQDGKLHHPHSNVICTPGWYFDTTPEGHVAAHKARDIAIAKDVNRIYIRENRFAKAVPLIAKWHEGGVRKSKNKNVALPYFTHCMKVMDLLFRWGISDVPTLITGLGHDLLEDTAAKEDEIARGLGLTVFNCISELTFVCPSGTSDKEHGQLKAQYIEAIVNKSIRAVVVKVADRISNILDFYRSDPAYAVKYYQKGKPIFAAAIKRSEDIQAFYGMDVLRLIAQSVCEMEEILNNPHLMLQGKPPTLIF